MKELGLSLLIVIVFLCSACNCKTGPSPKDTSFTSSSSSSSSDLVSPESGWYIDDEGYIRGKVPVEYSWELKTNKGTFIQKEMRDSLEFVPEFKKAFSEANEYAMEQVKPYLGKLGTIHSFWREKREFLEENYKIKWKTPAQLNDNIHFD